MNSNEQEMASVPISSVQSYDVIPSYDVTPQSRFPPPNPWTCMPMYQKQYSYQQGSSQVLNNFSFSSDSPYSPMGCQIWSSSFGTPTSVPQPLSGIQQPAQSPVQYQQKNSNPFFVRFITGNIRICQGCRGSLRLSDGSVPLAPDNIVIARLEKRPYFDKAAGTWCYPHKETHSHYHSRLACVVKAEPLFIPSALQVPPEIFTDLLPEHKVLLTTEFGLAL